MNKLWQFRTQSSACPPLADTAQALGISPRLAGLLWQRGFTTLKDMDEFLSPGLRHLMRPAAIAGLTQAAEALALSLGRGESLVVWGDYDVDGITSTALILDFLRLRGIEAGYYLPARLEEGYGLNAAGLEKLAAQGVKTVLTVDCGISALAEAERARELGLNLIITDHHLPGPALPKAAAVANPKLCPGPGQDLAGVGVAFFLAGAVNRLLPGEPVDMRQLLDLVAMGTLADVVSLTGQNRILVKNGLLLMSEAKRPGVCALKDVSGYNPKSAMEAGQVVFGLAPRINAAGRLGLAEAALRLLLAQDMETARPLAEALDQMNVKRRQEEEAISAEAKVQAEEQAHLPGMVLFSPNWHQGVIGIVASRVVEAHYRPTLILTSEHDHIKGSGRSIPEFDLYLALCACQDLLISFGGHRQAAGLSLAPENLPALRERFAKAAADQLGLSRPLPSLCLEGELSFADIHQPFLKELELLGPYGCGNPEPVFASGPLSVRSRRAFGTNHVSLDVRDNQAGVTLRAKAWRMADKLGPQTSGQTLRLAFTPRLDTYNGLASIELSVRDFRAGDA